MSISPEEIGQLYAERKTARGPLLNRWRQMTELADGDVLIPLPEMDKAEEATVVNLFPQGLDSYATRCASVQPDQSWPPLRDGIDDSEERARNRRLAGLDWWAQNEMQLLDYKRYRFYFGYGCAPVTISPVCRLPWDTRQFPRWVHHNPMHSFPAPGDDLSMEPVDCIFACRRTRSWLARNYGSQMATLNTGPADRARGDDTFDVLEYTDCDEIVLVVIGQAPREDLWTPSGMSRGAPCAVLERIVNKAGIPLVVFPGRITLGRLQGALDQLRPGYLKSAKLDAINWLAVTHQVFPEKWIVSHPGNPNAAEIITEANGPRGEIGEINNGTIIPIPPGVGAAQMADMAIDRAERAQRLVAGLPAELGGESATNIRTARRGEQVLGSAVDMPIAEAQNIFAYSKQHELHRAVAVQKGWYGSKSTSFYIPTNAKAKTTGRRLDYVPNELFDTDEVYVKYSMVGTDANSLVISMGQRINMGTASEQWGREVDPLIEDPILERDRVETEGLIRAMLAGLEAQAQQGTLQPDMIAMIIQEKMDTHDELPAVVLRVHQKMQAQQAATQQLPPGAPQQMPGLGAGQPPSNFQGPQSSPALAQILGNLRAPAKQSPQEQAMAPQPQQQMGALAQ